MGTGCVHKTPAALSEGLFQIGGDAVGAYYKDGAFKTGGKLILVKHGYTPGGQDLQSLGIMYQGTYGENARPETARKTGPGGRRGRHISGAGRVRTP
jgi:hypothetical protein